MRSLRCSLLERVREVESCEVVVVTIVHALFDVLHCEWAGTSRRSILMKVKCTLCH